MSSLPGLPRLCSLGGGTRDGHFATGEVISRDSARTSRREAPVTKDLLQQLGLNVELATAERGTVTKGVLMREPVECGGWSVMNTVPACYDMINPATNGSRVPAVSLAPHLAGRPTRRSKRCAGHGSRRPTIRAVFVSRRRSSDLLLIWAGGTYYGDNPIKVEHHSFNDNPGNEQQFQRKLPAFLDQLKSKNGVTH